MTLETYPETVAVTLLLVLTVALGLSSALSATPPDWDDLPRRDVNTVFIDDKLHGVGGDNSWGARTHAEYTIDGGQSHQYGFTLTPVRAK